VWTLQVSLARRTWRLLVSIVILLPALFFPIAVMVGGGAGWAIMGAAGASGLWAAAMFVVVYAGAGSKLMGAIAEDWTADDLRWLSRQGWRIVNGVKLHPWRDVDHVAVGPPGLLVVETKWSADAWPIGDAPAADYAKSRLAGHVEQAQRNAKDVKLWFRQSIGRAAPVRAVLVLWSSAPRQDGADWVQEGDVAVIHGPAFRRWLATVEGDVLDDEGVGRVWAAVAAEVEKKDASEEQKLGPRRPTLTQMWWRLAVQVPGGVAVAMFMVGALGRADLPWFGVLAGCVGGLLLGLLARRSPLLRWSALGWTLTFAVACALWPIFLVGYALR
jgi:hypothetical protein